MHHHTKWQVKRADYRLSVHQMAQMPTLQCPSIAFFGRSNVGKSSLINFLTGRKELAHVSRTPGRTQGINLYDVILSDGEQDYALCLLDLPGVGYAKLSKSQKEDMSRLLTSFLNEGHVEAIFHLLDSRREPSEEDVEFSEQLRQIGAAYCVLLTKIDSIAPSKRKPVMHQISALLKVNADSVVGVSTYDKIGKEQLLELWGDLVVAD